MKTRHVLILFLSLLLMVVFLLSACTPANLTASSPAPLEPTKEIPTFVFTETNTPQPATATEVPSSTPTFTPIPPTATITPTLAILTEGFTTWCVPENTQVSQDDKSNPWVMPGSVKPGEVVKGMTEVKYSAQWCTFVYKFNQPAPEGAKLEFSDNTKNPGESWNVIELKSVPGQPDALYAVTDHRFITNPPAWWVEYKLSVRTADGNVQWIEPVRFKRSWQMAPCWNTLMPNPVTLRCSSTAFGDMHPGDPGYGLPTWTTIPK